ncbi:MAG: hypothetical protein V2I54_10865 [Bacteroidales bacterium]|jgi:uncharacterized membrane protein (DUF2068 family)|nr:hypothetical protein [Bacteroidales bacterium]
MWIRFLCGVFILLHGLVHFWYVILSVRWIEFKPEMGWTGKSWLLDPVIPPSVIRVIAVFLFSFAALSFIVGSGGIFWIKEWTRFVLFLSAIISSFTIFLFYDGSPHHFVQKGILGVVINLVIILSGYFNQ